MGGDNLVGVYVLSVMQLELLMLEIIGIWSVGDVVCVVC